MKKISKVITMALAAITVTSALGVSAMAADDDGIWEARMAEAEYGTVNSLDELGVDTPVYTLNENGEIVFGTDEGINLLGLSNPPSNISGSTHSYIYGSGTSGSSKIHINTDTSFRYNFDSSCTTSTAQYAEFFVGATSTSQKVYFQGTGNADTTVKISLVPVSSSGSTLGPKSLPIHSSNYDFVYFNRFTNGALYAVKLTPTKAGKSVMGVINVSKNAF